MNEHPKVLKERVQRYNPYPVSCNRSISVSAALRRQYNDCMTSDEPCLFQDRNYTIHLNHTSLLKAVLLHSGVPEDKLTQASNILCDAMVSNISIHITLVQFKGKCINLVQSMTSDLFSSNQMCVHQDFKAYFLVSLHLFQIGFLIYAFIFLMFSKKCLASHTVHINAPHQYSMNTNEHTYSTSTLEFLGRQTIWIWL